MSHRGYLSERTSVCVCYCTPGMRIVCETYIADQRSGLRLLLQIVHHATGLVSSRPEVPGSTCSVELQFFYWRSDEFRHASDKFGCVGSVVEGLLRGPRRARSSCEDCGRRRAGPRL